MSGKSEGDRAIYTYGLKSTSYGWWFFKQKWNQSQWGGGHTKNENGWNLNVGWIDKKKLWDDHILLFCFTGTEF